MAHAPSTVLITGATSGIGRGLALAMHARGDTVIATGRNRQLLDDLVTAHPGMDSQVFDVSDRDSVVSAASEILTRHPDLSVIVNNAGIQHRLDFRAPSDDRSTLASDEIDTNLKGTVYMVDAFLPALLTQKSGRIVNVSSALGFVPLTGAPVYSATKAAVHSFTLSLRHQLRDTAVTVTELIPPVVTTGLHRRQAMQPPGALDLDTFVAEAMHGLDSGRAEVAVGRARLLRRGSRLAPERFLKLLNTPRSR